ncbi:hypothetical protein E6W39_38455 [Kitasatospora acidiphila]|uniref:Peptidase C39-like domain-containing protein n=1 Tax=Kitasatospora acidiphila TaxID=2567942 RepID=A0A540WDF7_9ACTN|nr:hypothetical protein [Kitasatospora acidiphila]TQF06998.1 hypothetical protein E6W39_38455 [Kitasatospora acidiphila]
MNHVAGKFGKLAPQFPTALRDFAAYAKTPLPAPPAAVDWANNVPEWPMDGNDQYGDCTMAAAAHMIQSWNAETKESDAVPTPKDVVAEYLQLTGGQDTGLVEADVLKNWQRSGLWGNTALGYAPVNVHDLTALQQTMWLFGAVYAGIQVPANAQTQFQQGQPWSLVPDWQQQPIEGGHAIPLLGYDADYIYAITWGGVQRIAWNWWSTYSDEAWAVLAQEYKEAGTVNGIDMAALTADLEQV